MLYYIYYCLFSSVYICIKYSHIYIFNNNSIFNEKHNFVFNMFNLKYLGIDIYKYKLKSFMIHIYILAITNCNWILIS